MPPTATYVSALMLTAFTLTLLPVLSPPVSGSLPVGSFDGVLYGVFGTCTRSRCSSGSVGYQVLTPNDSDWRYSASTRSHLSRFLLLHVVGAILTLVTLVLAVASHFHAASHSSRYLMAFFTITIAAMLVCVATFSIDLVMFAPHMAVGSWFALVAAILLLLGAITIFVNRRMMIDRKRRRLDFDSIVSKILFPHLQNQPPVVCVDANGQELETRLNPPAMPNTSPGSQYIMLKDTQRGGSPLNDRSPISRRSLTLPTSVLLQHSKPLPAPPSSLAGTATARPTRPYSDPFDIVLNDEEEDERHRRRPTSPQSDHPYTSRNNITADCPIGTDPLDANRTLPPPPRSPSEMTDDYEDRLFENLWFEQLRISRADTPPLLSDRGEELSDFRAQARTAAAAMRAAAGFGGGGRGGGGDGDDDDFGRSDSLTDPYCIPYRDMDEAGLIDSEQVESRPRAAAVDGSALSNPDNDAHRSNHRQRLPLQVLPLQPPPRVTPANSPKPRAASSFAPAYSHTKLFSDPAKALTPPHTPKHHAHNGIVVGEHTQHSFFAREPPAPPPSSPLPRLPHSADRHARPSPQHPTISVSRPTASSGTNVPQQSTREALAPLTPAQQQQRAELRAEESRRKIECDNQRILDANPDFIVGRRGGAGNHSIEYPVAI